ncbi:hypothetical protein HBB16_01810 [Pseudonocardia sp. MCCB 268]|nr:hypothetical protein [Pseudonocardia cytotoxica]
MAFLSTGRDHHELGLPRSATRLPATRSTVGAGALRLRLRTRTTSGEAYQTSSTRTSRSSVHREPRRREERLLPRSRRQQRARGTRTTQAGRGRELRSNPYGGWEKLTSPSTSRHHGFDRQGSAGDGVGRDRMTVRLPPHGAPGRQRPGP